jgi:hypothetical protein
MVRDKVISQPRQNPWANQWGISSVSGEAREPIGRRGVPDVARIERTTREWWEEKALFRDPRVWQVGHRIHVGCGEVDGERNDLEKLVGMTERR